MLHDVQVGSGALRMGNRGLDNPRTISEYTASECYLPYTTKSDESSSCAKARMLVSVIYSIVYAQRCSIEVPGKFVP